MDEINEKRERFSEYYRIPQEHVLLHCFYLFFSEFFAIPYCPPDKSVSQNTNVRCLPRSRLVRRVSPPSV